MIDESEKVALDLSSILQLKDVLSDFTVAEIVLAKTGSVILSDQGTWKYALITMSEYEQYLRSKKIEEPETDNQQLSNWINGAGKQFFINYYKEFKKNPLIGEEDLAEDFQGSPTSLRSRISRVRSIFKYNWNVDALKHIIESPKTDKATCEQALRLLHFEMNSNDKSFNNNFNWKFDNTSLLSNSSNFFEDGQEPPLEKLDNKRFAFKCIELLQEHGALDDDAIRILTDKDLCRDMFCCSGFPILSEVSLEGETTEEDICINGRQRFYNRKIIEGNRAFVLSNHWYGPNKSMPDNRTPFLAWVRERTDETKEPQAAQPML